MNTRRWVNIWDWGRINAHRNLVAKPLGNFLLARSRRYKDNINIDLREISSEDQRWMKLSQAVVNDGGLCYQFC